jgi:hypothetical protein
MALEVELGPGPPEELGVLGHRARPAALDEADSELVQQAGDRQLVDDRVGDALPLGTVAERGVEDLVRHGRSFGYNKQKDLPRMREVCARRWGLAARA